MESVRTPPPLPQSWTNTLTLVFAFGAVVFGALFYGAVIAGALVWHLPLLYVFALSGIAVCYLSYFVQGMGFPRGLSIPVVWCSIAVGAACLIILVEALVEGLF